MSPSLPTTPRTQIKRIPERANYDIAAIYAVLDNAPFATIAFNDGQQVHAIPTAIWRKENHLYIHGSNGSRLLKILQTGAEVCVSAAYMQGLVLARSALKHSMNYSSVCIYGRFSVVEESTKEQHLKHFMEHWMPGRWQYVRQPTPNELAAVTILRIALDEAVLKCRSGGPHDLEADLQQEVWAGVIPLQSQWQEPVQVAEQGSMELPGKSVRRRCGQ